MTIFRWRNLNRHQPGPGEPDRTATGPHGPETAGIAGMEKAKSGPWWARNWALVTPAGIFAIAGLEGYALSLGIDGTALRAALTSIGILGGAGFGRVLR